MKNVVIMCDTYLPKCSPNGICVSQVAKALSERNDNVRIVTTLNIEGQNAVENIDGIDVYRVDPGFVVRELMATDDKTDSASVKRRNKALKVSSLSGAINGFRYPLTAPVQVKNYYNCVEQLNNEQKIDVLVCCYHKIAAVAAGIKFKKTHPGTKFIVYTLDAISGGLVFPVLHSMKISMNSLKKWEKKIFTSVDKAFVMESHRSHYDSKEYDIYRDKLEFLDIPLIRTDRKGNSEQKDKLHFVYTGLMSIVTANPKSFLDLLKSLNTEDFVFDIYGIVTPEIEDIIKSSGLSEENVVLHGKVPYEDIDAIQKNADILLNFGNANPCMIPCKIFEYISTGKKILSFTHSEKDSSLPYLKIYPNALIIDENGDTEQNVERIRVFMKSEAVDINKEKLSQLYEKNMASYFCQQIDLL